MQLGIAPGMFGVRVTEQRAHHIVDRGGLLAYHLGARDAGEVMRRDLLANHFEIGARDFPGARDASKSR